MPRLYHRSQLALHIKRAICAHHVAHPLLRHVDLARWCFTRFGVRPDRSTIGRVLKGAEQWRIPDDAVDAIRVRGGAYPDLERAMARWIANAGRWGGRRLKERLIVGFLVNAEGSHAFRPLVISKAKRPHDFRPDYNPEELCYWRNTAKGWMTSSLFTHYIEQLDAAMNAEDRNIVVLHDNASSHNLTTAGAVTEDLFGFRTRALKNVRLVFMHPNTTCFIQPLDQGLIAMAKARYRQHWLCAFTGMWTAEGATSAAARFKPNLRLVLEWLHDAWMNIPRSTIQRCWWRTGCLPRAWAMELPHVEPGVGGGPTAGGDIGLDDDVNDVGSLIAQLGLGPSAMPAQEFVGIDDNQLMCAEPGEDPLAIEPRSEPTAEMWEAPASMQVVYDDSNPATREARRTARAACEMLIGYARARCITPRGLRALFDIRNPIIVARMERASPALNLNASPPPAETPRCRGRLLPAWTPVPTPDWVAQSARRQELIDAGAPAVMSGYLAAAEWMRL
ncbi:unnamed protein product [Closterium sp. NIES-64]|nr:unnamed protein product [Closterium sp. NIES-64]